MPCHCASQWMSIKTVQPGIAKTIFPHPLPVYVSYLPGQSCCRPSDSLSLRQPGGLWRARSQPTRGGLGHPLSTALVDCEGLFVERQREVRRRNGDIVKHRNSIAHFPPAASTTNWCENSFSIFSPVEQPQRTGDNKQQRDIKWQVYKSDFCLLLTPPALTLPGDTKQA